MAVRFGLAIALFCAAGALRAGPAAADPLPCPPPGGDPAYAVSLLGLTGPSGADLQLDVKPAPQTGCPRPTALKKLQIKVYALDGTLESTRNLTDIPATGGAADVRIGDVGRRQEVAAELLVQDDATTKTYVLKAATHVRLRPDLVVRSVTSTRVVFAGRTFDVGAEVAELNGDVGASATATLRDGTDALGTVPVTVDAGTSTDVTFPHVALVDPGRSDLTVSVQNASPGETDVTNNDRRAPIDVINVADHPDTSQVELGGYGAQMNQNVYATITGAPDSAFPDLESKVIAQHPGLVRVFYHGELNWPERLSFFRTLRLAQNAGATIDVTLVSIKGLNVGLATTRLANDLSTAVTDGVSNLRWVTIQNEPNDTALAPSDLLPWYQALDTKLRAKGLRSGPQRIGFMGLDLVATKQKDWFDYAATNMSDLLDAYSIHVFWNYWDTAKLEQRLEEVRAIVDLEPARKPIYAMEYGVRGIRTIGATSFGDPGVWDATEQIPLTQTNVNAFQQAWFDVLAAQLGYAGTVKWDSYYGKYDNTPQAYFMLGQWDENGLWPVYPIYNVVRLFTAISRPGWNVTGVEQDSLTDTRLAASYAGPNGELTVVGLDRAGGQLNGLSPTLVPYGIGGLPASTTFHLIEWNRDGDGRNVDAGPVTTDDAGVARFDVPLNAVFGLTTLTPQL